MFKHILIATDGSDLATKAAATGLNLAKSLGASVNLCYGHRAAYQSCARSGPVSSPADEYEATLTTTAMAILTSASAEASKHGIHATPCTFAMTSRPRASSRRPKVKDAMSSSWHPMDEEASRDWSSGASPCGCSRIVRCQSSSAVDRTRRPRLSHTLQPTNARRITCGPASPGCTRSGCPCRSGSMTRFGMVGMHRA